MSAGMIRDITETVSEESVGMPTPYLLLITCPDCGPQVALHSRCPKCCGKSWTPTGTEGARRMIRQNQTAKRLQKHLT
jgi:hypothetical protein